MKMVLQSEVLTLIIGVVLGWYIGNKVKFEVKSGAGKQKVKDRD